MEPDGGEASALIRNPTNHPPDPRRSRGAGGAPPDSVRRVQHAGGEPSADLATPAVASDGDVRRPFVVRVARADAELAADRLWQAGASAVVERDVGGDGAGDAVELVADLEPEVAESLRDRDAMELRELAPLAATRPTGRAPTGRRGPAAGARPRTTGGASRTGGRATRGGRGVRGWVPPEHQDVPRGARTPRSRRGDRPRRRLRDRRARGRSAAVGRWVGGGGRHRPRRGVRHHPHRRAATASRTAWSSVPGPSTPAPGPPISSWRTCCCR